MNHAAKGFAAWACDSKRSLEERFGAEILIEQTIGLWRNQQGIKQDTNYQAEQLRKKDRSLNPAYTPDFTAEDAARVETVLPGLKEFSSGYYDDRPLRDISFLRFCPPLQSLRIHKSEIRDWSPLEAHLTLTKLDLWDNAARDLRVISLLTRLENLHLWLGWPWPDLAGLENLRELRELNFHGNILALQAVPTLPQVRLADIEHGQGYNIPFRTLHDLPAMPELRCLKLINTAELDGIERYPNLLNLEIYGYFTDLNPLTELRQLTHLFLSGGDYPHIAPLARLPKLCDLLIRHEEPPDFTPLADAPCLHEIRLEYSSVVPAELASLNAMLNPWSDEFGVHPPRPLAPLRLRLRAGEPHAENDSGGSPRDYGENADMAKSEARWFAREVNRRLNALLGKGWGEVSERHTLSPGNEHVTICRPEDLDRVPEIVQSLRQLLAAARHPWSYLLIIDSEKYYERDMNDIYSAEGEKFNAEREREEWEYQQQRKRERKEFLERKYRLRLQQELGTPVNPADFAPPPPPEPETEDTVTAGDFGVEEKPEYDLGIELSLYATLTEKAVYIHESDRGLAELLLEIKAEE